MFTNVTDVSYVTVMTYSFLFRLNLYVYHHMAHVYYGNNEVDSVSQSVVILGCLYFLGYWYIEHGCYFLVSSRALSFSNRLKIFPLGSLGTSSITFRPPRSFL